MRPSLYLDSNTAMAARDPDPIVAKGRVSVEPWGKICSEESHQLEERWVHAPAARRKGRSLHTDWQRAYRVKVRPGDVNAAENQSSTDVSLVPGEERKRGGIRGDDFEEQGRTTI